MTGLLTAETKVALNWSTLHPRVIEEERALVAEEET